MPETHAGECVGLATVAFMNRYRFGSAPKVAGKKLIADLKSFKAVVLFCLVVMSRSGSVSIGSSNSQVPVSFGGDQTGTNGIQRWQVIWFRWISEPIVHCHCRDALCRNRASARLTYPCLIDTTPNFLENRPMNFFR